MVSKTESREPERDDRDYEPPAIRTLGRVEELTRQPISSQVP